MKDKRITFRLTQEEWVMLKDYADRHEETLSQVLRDIVKMIEARSDEIVRRWVDYFGDVSYFC